MRPSDSRWDRGVLLFVRSAERSVKVRIKHAFAKIIAAGISPGDSMKESNKFTTTIIE